MKRVSEGWKRKKDESGTIILAGGVCFMKLKTAVIKQKIILQALPDKVYDALLNPRILSEFTGSKATGKTIC
jgi:hypothetical protein